MTIAPPDSEDESPTLFFQLALQIYTTLLLVIGLPGNGLSGYIMSTDKTNRITTRILMGIIAAADTAVLLTAVTRYWALEVLNTDYRSYNDLICKIHVFAVAFTTDFAVGALCAVAVERFLVVAFPQKASVIVSVPIVITGMVTFAGALFAKNGIHFLIMEIRHEPSQQGTFTSPVCIASDDYSRWTRIFMKVDFISFAILPYIILFSCNLYIYCVLKRQRRLLSTAINQRRSRSNTDALCPLSMAQPKKSSATDDNQNVGNLERTINTLTPISHRKKSGFGQSKPGVRLERRKRKPEDVIKVLTALTVVHVVCTLPGTLFTLLSEYLDLRRHKPTKFVLVMLIFTNNAINFFAYLASSERFRERVIDLLSCGRSGQMRRRQTDLIAKSCMSRA